MAIANSPEEKQTGKQIYYRYKFIKNNTISDGFCCVSLPYFPIVTARDLVVLAVKSTFLFQVKPGADT